MGPKIYVEITGCQDKWGQDNGVWLYSTIFQAILNHYTHFQIKMLINLKGIFIQTFFLIFIITHYLNIWELSIRRVFNLRLLMTTDLICVVVLSIDLIRYCISDHSSWVLVGYFPTNVEISIAVKEEFYQDLHKACKTENH